MRKANHQLAINHLKKSDPVMAEIIARIGPFRMQFGEPTFHALAESILYQQLNGKAAATIFDRFTALAGDPLTPKGILKLTDTEMRGVGLSRQKTAYLRDLAEKTKAGLLEFERLPELPEAEVIAHLTQVKGVGVWTVSGTWHVSLTCHSHKQRIRSFTELCGYLRCRKTKRSSYR